MNAQQGSTCASGSHRGAFYQLHPGWGLEAETGVFNRDILLHGRKDKLSLRAIGLLDEDSPNLPSGVHFQGHFGHPISHAGGDATNQYGAGLVSCPDGEILKFLFEFGLAEQVAKRRTEIVEVSDRRLACLALARNIEISRFAITNEELLFGISIFPAHLSRPP